LDDDGDAFRREDDVFGGEAETSPLWKASVPASVRTSRQAVARAEPFFSRTSVANSR